MDRLFITAAMGLVTLMTLPQQAVGTRALQEQQTMPFSVTYEYRVDLNVSGTIPSIKTAVELLRNDTLAYLETLLDGQDDVVLDDFVTTLTGPCSTPSGTSELCSFAESTLSFTLDPAIDLVLVEYATLDEAQALIETFNQDYEDVFVSFVGPSVVRADVAILLEHVHGKMSDDEVAIFEEVLLNLLSGPMLQVDPPITVRTAEIFLQVLKERVTRRRRLQGTNPTTTAMDNVVRVHVTGQCNGCTSSQFERKIGEAVDTSRPDLQRNLEQRGQEEGTDYFDNVTASVAEVEKAPGVSESGLDIFQPLDPFPYWVPVVLGVLVVVISIGVCCAACRSRRERTAEKKEHIKRTPTADESQGESSKENGQTAEEPTRTRRTRTFRRDLDVMPHLREAVTERLSQAQGDQRSVRSAPA